MRSSGPERCEAVAAGRGGPPANEGGGAATTAPPSVHGRRLLRRSAEVSYLTGSRGSS